MTVLDPAALLDFFHRQQPAMLDRLAELVNYESPSLDKAHLDQLATYLASQFQAAGTTVAQLAHPAGGNHLRATFSPPATAANAPALILCHYDTVWPVGTVASRPFTIRDGRAYGPGVYDMKASLVLAEFALRAVSELQLALPRPVTLLFTSDEEIGSPTSRALIEDQARHAAYVLVLEPPVEGGALKTARKGIGHYTVEISGRAAHAGVEPERGISAVTEMAHQVLALAALGNPPTGTTVNVGIASGGTRANVVAAQARLEIDVRAWSNAEANRVDTAIQALQPHLAGASLQISGGFNRPPMERTPAITALFQRARSIGATLGMNLQEGSTGGGSDGNFTAAIGTPTLDGLGTPGMGAHADHEQIELAALPQRAALLVALLHEL